MANVVCSIVDWCAVANYVLRRMSVFVHYFSTWKLKLLQCYRNLSTHLYFSGTCGRNWHNIVRDSGEGARVPSPGVEGSAQSRWQCSRRPEEARLIYCTQLAATIFHLSPLIWLFITLCLRKSTLFTEYWHFITNILEIGVYNQY